jgi:glycosyltransferase involved in cell wall biosynthesis
MRADLHVHSKFSKRPSQWILQKINCPESFTEPLQLYRIARQKGMSLVTVTDHNTIDGALEISHLPNTFISVEVTTYFPEDGCKIHVLAYHINESQHENIHKVRENIFDLVQYLTQENIVHAVAHPLYSINDRLTAEHFEILLLLFKNFELNGARDEVQNRILQVILSGLTQEELERLSEKHGLEPAFAHPWRKNFIGGSDDHSSLNIARMYTEVEKSDNVEDFLQAIGENRASVAGRYSTPLTLAHNLYGITYQFYKDRLNLERYVQRDLVLRFLDRFLNDNNEPEGSVWSRFYCFWNQQRQKKYKSNSTQSVHQLLRDECQKLISADPDLMEMVKIGNGDKRRLENKWFDFVNKLSNKVLLHFGNHLFDRLYGANVFDIFTSIGSAAALYSLLAPYFVSFTLFSQDKNLAGEILHKVAPEVSGRKKRRETTHVAHFTDTFYEVNGVALTLQQQVKTAVKLGKKLTIITCDDKPTPKEDGIRNFRPTGGYELPEYPELTLFYPPFLEMLHYCYEHGATHIHSATPGPIGLAALAISRILKLPFSATYHTSLPQYTLYLTGDSGLEGLMWRYVIWYYDQTDQIFVPSQSTGQELIQRGIHAEKIRLYPRGINVERFHPSKQNTLLDQRYGLKGLHKLLYVGRVSKEKNLELLVEVFKSLVQKKDNISLIVVGDGPYLQEMKRELRDTPAVFTGYLEGEELPAVYASCDLFVFPSSTDTFGNVVLEAQASGCPVIVTDSGGPQENLIPGQTGVVIPANDGRALLKGIQRLLFDPERLTQMGREARRYMEDRSFEKCFQRMWRVYEEETTGAESDLAIAV